MSNPGFSGVIYGVVLLFVFCGLSQAADVPFIAKPGLFDQANTVSLGLTLVPGTETVTIFRPTAATDHYSNNVVMVAFKGWLYCQWQSSVQNEDSPDTWLAYSRCKDGRNWASPMTLVANLGTATCTSGGWWIAGDTLVSFVNVWPSSVSPRGGNTWYTQSVDGLIWSPLKPVMMANGDTLEGVFEQDPHALPDGRIIGAAHFQPGLIVAPIYTDDPSGVRGWVRAPFPNLTHTGTNSREMEPGWYLREDDAVVMTFRDQNGTYRRLASVSYDRGQSWSTPVVTNMPDSRAKQSAGNLPDGAAFLVGNPVENKTRIPLAVTLSNNGRIFTTAFALRQGGADLQAQQYTGTAKTLGYSYPKSMLWQGYLYVSYSTNKEDVEYTRVPIDSIHVDDVQSQYIALNKGWNLVSTNMNPIDSSLDFLFSGLAVNEIKTMDSFWRAGQNDAFNTLKTITSGNGYLVDMKAAGLLNVAGVHVEAQYSASPQQNSWRLIGCPLQSAALFSSYFGQRNCVEIKSFDGFWRPNGTKNSIFYLEPGKGYYIK